MSNRRKRVLAWLLVLTMIFSSNEVSVLATEALPAEDQEVPVQEAGSEVLEFSTEESEQTVPAEETEQTGEEEALLSADTEEALTAERKERYTEGREI